MELSVSLLVEQKRGGVDILEGSHAGSRQDNDDPKYEVQRLRERVECLGSMETRILDLYQV